MKDLNRCAFIGRLGKDPEITASKSGMTIANFSIACADDRKDKQTGAKIEQTEWVNLVAFDRLADVIAQYVTKGSRIYVEGKFHTEKWQDQQGNNRSTVKVIASELQMLDSKQAGQASPQQQQQPQHKKEMTDAEAQAFFDDEIPF